MILTFDRVKEEPSVEIIRLYALEGRQIIGYINRTI